MSKSLFAFLALALTVSVSPPSQARKLQSYQVGIVNNPCAQVIPKGHQLNLDFGQLCKYERANSNLPAPTDSRVVYFGDSITELWSNLPGLRADDTRNRGISGQTSSQMLVRFKADVLDLKPRVVHLLMGTNDIAGNTGATTLHRLQTAVTSMAEQARDNGIRVVIASIPPAKAFTWRAGIEPRDHILAHNRWLKSYAAREGFVFVDYYSVLEDGDGGMKPEFSPDGVHPNSLGYKAMAPLALDAIKKAIN